MTAGRIKNKLYEVAAGQPLPLGESPIPLSSAELAYFLYRKGFWQYLRGWLLRPLLGSCGGRLFVGKKVDVWFPGYISVGRNVYLGDYSYVNGLSKSGIGIGSNVRIREYAWIQATSRLQHIGEGLEIGENTYVGPRCLLGAAGGIKIGSHVVMGAEVHLLAEDHEFGRADVPIKDQGVTRKGIVIEDDVWIGNRVIVLDGVRVGKGSVIGAGAVVTRDVPSNCVVAGNPAKMIGRRGRSRRK
jgi:acetyltransferase-like isoleucine patch superfamily enzyme